MTFDLLSIIFIAILILFAIIGLKRGFFKTVLSLLKGVLSFFVSIFIARPFGALLSKTSIAQNASNNLVAKLVEKGGIFALQYNESLNNDTFNSLNMDENLEKLIVKLIAKVFPSIEDGQKVADIIGPCIIYAVCIAIAFVLSFILLRIVVSILGKMFKGLERSKLIKFTNRLLGCALNIVIGLCLIGIATYVFTLIIPLDNNASVWLTETMHLNEDVNTISKYFYMHNPINWIINNIIKLFI